MKENAPVLGKLISGDAQRDAIHIAVAPVVSGAKLKPGDHVGLIDGKACQCDSPVGIVDPFLNFFINPGEQFYLFLYPNTVTGLRHEWTHPAFSDGPQGSVAESVAWIKSLADDYGVEYRTLIELGERAVSEDCAVVYDTKSLQDYLNENKGEFFRHWSIATGNHVPQSIFDDFYFSCSC